MDKKQFLKDYLVFSKKERIGIYCILAIILLFYLRSSFFSNIQPANNIILDTALVQLIDTIQKQEKHNTYIAEEHTYNFEPSKESGFTKEVLFPFDPNTLAAEGWSRLGLKERTIKTIMNYRSKGGKFYKPEDLQRIWGLPNGFYEYVSSYIQITSIPQSSTSSQTFVSTTKQKYEKKISIIDINVADTTVFIALPGIGSKLASRIVNFREKLGGFHNLEQIKETYGLPDSTFQKIKPYLQVNTSGIRKMNINTATKEELKPHPYLRWQLANAIVEYRNQHGVYKNLEELKKIMLIDEATFSRIAPYLSL